MAAESDLLQIEVALRDSRHTDVIMALDRLVLLPQTRDDLQQAKADLLRVKQFFENYLQKQYMDAAKAVFREHATLVMEHGTLIMSAQNGNREK